MPDGSRREQSGTGSHFTLFRRLCVILTYSNLSRRLGGSFSCVITLGFMLMAPVEVQDVPCPALAVTKSCEQRWVQV